jgi:diguanylate cyclase (GGDEF)-like protein
MMDDFEREPDRAYGLIFFDVDHLKEANDQFGHKVGDQLIRTAAMNIAKALPGERGFACRWGGDEFLMVLSDPNEIEIAEENLAKEIQEVNDKKVFDFPYSISYGHAIHYSNSSKGFAELRALADRRMYEMKKKTHAERL